MVLNLHMLIKQKSLSLPRDLALRTFGELLIVFSAKEGGGIYGAGAGLFKREAGTFPI